MAHNTTRDKVTYDAVGVAWPAEHRGVLLAHTLNLPEHRNSEYGSLPRSSLDLCNQMYDYSVECLNNNYFINTNQTDLQPIAINFNKAYQIAHKELDSLLRMLEICRREIVQMEYPTTKEENTKILLALYDPSYWDRTREMITNLALSYESMIVDAISEQICNSRRSKAENIIKTATKLSVVLDKFEKLTRQMVDYYQKMHPSDAETLSTLIQMFYPANEASARIEELQRSVISTCIHAGEMVSEIEQIYSQMINHKFKNAGLAQRLDEIVQSAHNMNNVVQLVAKGDQKMLLASKAIVSANAAKISAQLSEVKEIFAKSVADHEAAVAAVAAPIISLPSKPPSPLPIAIKPASPVESSVADDLDVGEVEEVTPMLLSEPVVDPFMSLEPDEPNKKQVSFDESSINARDDEQIEVNAEPAVHSLGISPVYNLAVYNIGEDDYNPTSTELKKESLSLYNQDKDLSYNFNQEDMMYNYMQQGTSDKQDSKLSKSERKLRAQRQDELHKALQGDYGSDAGAIGSFEPTTRGKDSTMSQNDMYTHNPYHFAAAAALCDDSVLGNLMLNVSPNLLDGGKELKPTDRYFGVDPQATMAKTAIVGGLFQLTYQLFKKRVEYNLHCGTKDIKDIASLTQTLAAFLHDPRDGNLTGHVSQLMNNVSSVLDLIVPYIVQTTAKAAAEATVEEVGNLKRPATADELKELINRAANTAVRGRVKEGIKANSLLETPQVLVEYSRKVMKLHLQTNLTKEQKNALNKSIKQVSPVVMWPAELDATVKDLNDRNVKSTEAVETLLKTYGKSRSALISRQTLKGKANPKLNKKLRSSVTSKPKAVKSVKGKTSRDDDDEEESDGEEGLRVLGDVDDEEDDEDTKKSSKKKSKAKPKAKGKSKKAQPKVTRASALNLSDNEEEDDEEEEDGSEGEEEGSDNDDAGSEDEAEEKSKSRSRSRSRSRGRNNQKGGKGLSSLIAID